MELKKIVYIPTASYFPSIDSKKSKGEQKRRARYDAKEKFIRLKNAFSIEVGMILF